MQETQTTERDIRVDVFSARYTDSETTVRLDRNSSYKLSELGREDLEPEYVLVGERHPESGIGWERLAEVLNRQSEERRIEAALRIDLDALPPYRTPQQQISFAEARYRQLQRLEATDRTKYGERIN